MAKYQVTKHLGHERGYTVAFRQWRAEGTKCRFIHSYALAFTFVIEGEELDHRNWLYSFGDFKEIKAWLEENFDHTTLIAGDDPLLEKFMELDKLDACQLVVLPSGVGCEKIAELVYRTWSPYIYNKSETRAALKSVTVAEHPGNSVTYSGE